jgi:DNA polymerase III subunit delta
MAITPTQLERHLGHGLKNLYTLVGDEPLLQQEAQDCLRSAARSHGFSERSVHVIAGAHFDWNEILSAMGSQSLFADKNLVEIRIPTGKPGKEGSVLLQQIAEKSQYSSDVLLMVQLPKLDKATRSTAWFGALEKYGEIISIETIARAHLAKWIAERLARCGLQVVSGHEGQRILQLFVDKVEGNLLAAHQEIEKLRLLHPEASSSNNVTLTWDLIEKNVLNVARYDVFKLSETILSGHMARTHRMLSGLAAEGEAEVLVHFVISEDIRNLKAAKDMLALAKPMPMVLRELRIWGDRERMFERVIPKISIDKLAILLYDAHTVDGIIKGIPHRDWPASGWQSLHRLAHSLCLLCSNS